MKLKSIKISGMHNVTNKQYSFDDITYICGKNGAGKSTILQAVQLALLGYIPGTNKTPSAILTHANGPMLMVSVMLSDDNEEITITRTFMKKGAGGTALVDIQPEKYKNLDTTEILGNLELPIFNFNDFIDLSANKLKDWFIKFLPSNTNTINWDEALMAPLKKFNLEDINSNIIQETNEWISENLKDKTSEIQIEQLNSYFKEMLSSKKYLLDATVKSIGTLVFYDDIEAENISEESLASKTKVLLSDISNFKFAKQYVSSQKTIQEQLSKLSKEIPDTCTIETDKTVIKLKETCKNLEMQKEKTTSNLLELRKNQGEIEQKITDLNKIISSDGVCPFTKSSCKTIKDFIETLKLEKTQAEEELKSILTKIDDSSNMLSSIDAELSESNDKIFEITNKYNARDNILNRNFVLPEAVIETLNRYNFKDIFKITETEFDECIEKCSDELSTANENLKQIAANKQYNKLIDELTKNKVTQETEIDILKEWIKLTGENGIINDIMQEAFITFEKLLDSILCTMFSNKKVKSKFIVKPANNSFDFGLTRDSIFIPFNALSSGEQCIYTIALMSAIIATGSAKSAIKLIIIDDLIDHLDETNIDALFTAISKTQNIQYLFAGVQKCEAAKKFTKSI